MRLFIFFIPGCPVWKSLKILFCNFFGITTFSLYRRMLSHRENTSGAFSFFAVIFCLILFIKSSFIASLFISSSIIPLMPQSRPPPSNPSATTWKNRLKVPSRKVTLHYLSPRCDSLSRKAATFHV